MNKAIIANPIRKISIEQRKILAIALPDAAKKALTLGGFDFIGQIDDFKQVEKNVAVICIRIFARAHAIAPIKIPGKL